MPLRPRHHDPRARHQGAEELPDGGVEVERRLLQHDVRRTEAVRALHPHHVIDGAAMLVHRPLRRPRRTRRVDHVGQVPRRQAHARRTEVLAPRVAPELAIGVQIDGVAHAGRRGPRRAVNQHDHGRAVVQQVCEAPGWVRRIQRDVGAARLEGREERHDHLDAPLHADRHARIRHDAGPAQVVGEAVRPRVQLAIGHALVAEHDGHRVRRSLHLRFEQLVQAQSRGNSAAVAFQSTSRR